MLAAGGLPIQSNDLHVFLAMGESMAQSGELMEVESFTWTEENKRFINGAWGFSYLSWQLYELFGLAGLRIFTGLTVASSIALLARAAVLRGADVRSTAYASLFTCLLLIQNVGVRAQSWVYPLFATLVWWRARKRHPTLSIAVALGLGCAWANLHGSFLVAYAVLGISACQHWFSNRDWPSTKSDIVFALSFLAGTCVGPYGPELYVYVLQNSTLPADRGLSEWEPVSLWSSMGIRLTVGVVIWGLLLLKKPRGLKLEEGLTLLLFGGLALSASRFVSWFGLGTSVLLALRFHQNSTPSPSIPKTQFRRLCLLLTACWTVLLLRALWPKGDEMSAQTPTLATQAIQESATTGRIFTPPEFGGYLRFELGETWTVSSDMRVWIFGDAAWSLYPRLVQAPADWEEQLVQADVTHLLLIPDSFHQKLIPAVKASENWALLAEDNAGVAFQRSH